MSPEMNTADAPFKDAVDTAVLPAQSTGLFLCFSKLFFQWKKYNCYCILFRNGGFNALTWQSVKDAKKTDDCDTH